MHKDGCVKKGQKRDSPLVSPLVSSEIRGLSLFVPFLLQPESER